MSEPVQYISAIDVSSWQGDIRWPMVAESGIKVSFVKASEGASGERSRDKLFAVNARGAAAAGIVVVPYCFFGASDPEEQARNFLAVVNALPWRGILGRTGCPHVPDETLSTCLDCGAIRVPTSTMLDLERSGSPGTDLGARALAWLGIVEAALGCTAWIYVSPYFAAMEHLDRHPELASRPLLLADPRMISHPDGETPAPWSEWSGRQTGIAEVPGVHGPCDVDVLRVMPG